MDKAFKFNLQKVLEIRKDREDESIRDFKKSQSEKKSMEDNISFLENSYDKYKTIKSDEDIVYQKIKRLYLNSLTQTIDEKKQELKFKEVEVLKKREILKEKRVERRTVEILKEKQYDAFIKEQNRLEKINNDELALYAFMRNKKQMDIERR